MLCCCCCLDGFQTFHSDFKCRPRTGPRGVGAAQSISEYVQIAEQRNYADDYNDDLSHLLHRFIVESIGSFCTRYSTKKARPVIRLLMMMLLIIVIPRPFERSAFRQ
jgi:hypothetical protein